MQRNDSSFSFIYIITATTLNEFSIKKLQLIDCWKEIV